MNSPPEDQVEPIVVMLSNHRGGDVLELGCGTGRNAVYLAEQGARVTAVDSNLKALERLEQRAYQRCVHPRIKTMHGHPLDPIEGEWDAVVICLVLHELVERDASLLLTRIQARTKPHGMNAIIGWSDEGEAARNIRAQHQDAFLLTREFLLDRYRLWHRRSQGHRVQDGGRILTGLYAKPA